MALPGPLKGSEGGRPRDMRLFGSQNRPLCRMFNSADGLTDPRRRAFSRPGEAKAEKMTVQRELEGRRAAIADVKRLLRAARVAALATLGRRGAPLTTWVGCASDFDGSPLFLLSQLAEHTRNLAADRRGSLLLVDAPGRGDPLNHPRVTLGGTIQPHFEPLARPRYLRRNPKAKLYAAFADFAIYRLSVETVHFNGGFGRAAPLEPADILSPPGDATALAAAEEKLLAEINAPKGAITAWRASRRPAWRAVGLDVEGLDLAAGKATARVDFAASAFDPSSWRERLVDALATAP
ncbi:MAG: pyridoxamine 5'-phosphate oxidase [Bradyrhizobium sp.]|nr:MAG: pyridoxamine 5'-phosphate oxidase [Bradyrhizobium sp.]